MSTKDPGDDLVVDAAPTSAAECRSDQNCLKEGEAMLMFNSVPGEDEPDAQSCVPRSPVTVDGPPSPRDSSSGASACTSVDG